MLCGRGGPVVAAARLLVPMLVACALALAACSSAQREQSQHQAQQVASAAPRIAEDALVDLVVKGKLASVDIDSTTDVHVAVADGHVTLTGRAHSAREREAYAAAARTVNGVKSVTNELTVDPHLLGPRERTADTALDARVSAAIAEQAGANVFHVKPSAQDGVVTLDGVAPSPSVKATILQTIARVSGVKRVVDHIQVKS